MRLTITIDCENEAFGENDCDRSDECSRILDQLAARLESKGFDDFPLPLFDVNGNRVGVATFGGAA